MILDETRRLFWFLLALDRCFRSLPRIPISLSLLLTYTSVHAINSALVLPPASTMVSLLQDLYVRFRHARGSGSWLKTLTWRNYLVLAIGLSFLITISRTYMPYPWLTRPEEEVLGPPVNWVARANAVKQAFVHAYHGYEAHAFPEDELLPLTNSSKTK